MDYLEPDQPLPVEMPPAVAVPQYAPATPERPLWRRATGAIAAAGVALAKWGAILFKLKVFTFAASMLVSIAAYAWLWGWRFGLGFVLLILIHEMGHVVALRAMGIKAGAPTFIPFFGAFVQMRQQPKTAWHEAVSGIAGPVFGAAGAAALWWYADQTGSGLLHALAFTGFFLNLFNLIPMLPLDGGRAAAALHPSIWLLGLVALLALMLYHPNFVIMLILILGGTEAWRRFRGRNTADARAYYTLTRQQRQIMTIAYFGLIAVLVFAMHATYAQRAFPS
jgi:Zn-dependent protease